MSVEAGQTLSHYRLIEKTGEGGGDASESITIHEIPLVELEGEGQVQALTEAVVGLLRVCVDPHDVRVRLLEALELPTKLAGLLRSALGEGLGKEEDHDPPALQHLVEHALPDLEVGGVVPRLEHAPS